MYIRLFTTMVIGLYTSRLVLEILGVSDYGLFAVVGGVLGMFTFISGSLAGATSRFLNTEMGKIDGDVNACFNINLLLHICFAAIIFVLAESIGLWYIHNHLNIAEGKLDDATFIYHVSIFTACLGIINTPYTSLFNAYERFRFMAVLDIFNSFIRLGAILMLTLISARTVYPIFSFSFTILKLYALIEAFTKVNTFVIYHYVAYKSWPHIIKQRFIKGWKKYKAVLNFGGWNLLSTLSNMARSSGSDLILNSFFGTAMNGAFAISNSVRQYSMQFATKFDGASAPQIIQAYAANDKERYTYLANKIGKINILAFEIVCFPLLIELDFILHLWLGKVPDGALEFTYINIIVGGMALTSGGIINVINASGEIKWFKINVSFFFLMCVPVGWMLFYFGFPAYSMLLLFLFADLTQRIIQLIQMKYILHFDSWRYVREAYLPSGLIAIIMTIVLLIHSFISSDNVIFRLASIAICSILTTILVYTIGLTKGEKQAVKNKLHLS